MSLPLMNLPSEADTPRTKDLKSLRQKRVAYYDSLQKESDKKSPRPPVHPKTTSPLSTPASHSSSSINSSNFASGSPNVLPSTSSPRVRRAVFRPRAASANSRSGESNSIHVNGSHKLSPRVNSNRQDVYVSPRRRSGSFSSDHGLNDKGVNDTKRVSARDSFESLFSDIGSEFTDITNTDLLLTDRLADQPVSLLLDRHGRSSNRSSSKTRNLSSDRSEKKGFGETEVNQKIKTSQANKITLDVSNLTNTPKQRHSQTWEHSSDSDFSLELKIPLKGKNKTVTSKQSNTITTSVKRSPRQKPDNKNLLLYNESLETLTSGSHNTSGHLTSDRTSVWLESDKSTGYRTFSNDTMFDDLLPDNSHNSKESFQIRNDSTKSNIPVVEKDVSVDVTVSLNKSSGGNNKMFISEEQGSFGVSREKQPLQGNADDNVFQVFTQENVELKANLAISSDFLHSKGNEQSNIPSPAAKREEIGNSVKSSNAVEEFNFSNLSAVLGEERLKRLLQNFQESEDYSDIQSDAHSNIKKGSALDDVNIWASLDTDDGTIVSEYQRNEKNRNILKSVESKTLDTHASNSSTNFNDQRNEISNKNIPMSGKVTSNKVKPVAHVYPERYHDMVNNSQEISMNTKNGNLHDSNNHFLYSSSQKVDDVHQLSLDIQALQSVNNNDESESIITELDLHTHRPSDSPREINLPYHHSKQETPDALTKKDITSPGTTQESGTVKYCFSVDEIYAQAGTLPFTGVAPKVDSVGSPQMISRKDVQLKSNVSDSVNSSVTYVPPAKISVASHQGIQNVSTSYNSKEPANKTVKSNNDVKTRSKPPSGDGIRGSHSSVDKDPRSSVNRKLAWSMDTGEGHSLMQVVNQQSLLADNANEFGQGDAGKYKEERREDERTSSGVTQKLPDLQSKEEDRGPVKSVAMMSKPMPPSIERYFQSIEQLSYVSSVCSDTFEPVPEPDIEITPRGPMVVQGTHMSTSVDSTASKPPAAKPSQKSTKKPKLSEGEPSAHNSRKSPNRLDQVSDDELYHLVQSAITEIDTARSGAITQKLQDLGINFDFLKESYESHKSARKAVDELQQNEMINQDNINGNDIINPDSNVSPLQAEGASGDKSEQICPGCGSNNQIDANKCKKCAKNLSNMQTGPVQCFKSPRMSVTNKNDHIQKKQNVNRISKDSSKSSITITSNDQLNNNLQAQLSLNLRSSINSVDSSATTSMQTNTISQGSRARNRRRNLLKDKNWMDADSSISLDYSEKFDNPRESIPHILKAELSIDVRGSSESSQPPSLKGKSSGVKHARKSFVQDIKVRDDSETNSIQHVPINGAHSELGVEGELRINMDDVITVDEEIQTEDNQEVVIEASYQDFLQRLINDPRLRNKKSGGNVLQPSASQGRPSTAGARKGQYAGVQSKVKLSWDKEQPQRKWEKSNLAWSSYNSRELSKPSGTGLTAKSVQIPRPSSAGKSRDASPRQATQKNPRPQSADITGRRSLPHHDCGSNQLDVPHYEPQNSHRPSGPLLNVQAVSNREKPTERDSKNNRMNNYKKYLALSPRIHSGEMSFMQCLPDEIMLMIFSYLSHRDLAKCMVVCQHFHRVAGDDSLWRKIVIKKSINMTDGSLLSIAKKQPQSLSLLQCHGSKVTAQGLRDAFRTCADSLQELNFTGCSRGHLTGDHILLHASSRCVNITSLDASWCNVNDNGVMAMSEASQRLSSLCVNGCQQLSDDAVNSVVIKHGIYLNTLELFGCFNITARGIASVANHCKSLVTLNLGQCWKLTDSCISNLAPSLTSIENLDLRGCKQIKDHTIHQVVKHCPHLTTLSLANCPNLTDIAMSELATYCPNIRSLDVCGCKNITNQGVRAITHSCQNIEYLDLSSTAITSKSVTTLASYNSQRLEVLKINFCKQITMQSLVKLAKNCKKLERLFLYGVRGLGPLEEVKQQNRNLHIETDQARPV